MAKLILNDVTSLESTSFLETINTNSAAIETAMEKTLSRDGTSPNMMNSSLDMNSNRIINLPNSSSDSEPVTAKELRDLFATVNVGAVIDAQYIVGASSSGLLSERVVTNTSNITWDLGTTGQAKASISGIIPIVNGGTGNDGGAWTTYTPVITVPSGTVAAVSKTGRYRQMGKTIFINIDIQNITYTGSPAFLEITIPIAPKANSVLFGRNPNQGTNVGANMVALSTVIGALNYAGSWPVVANDNLQFTGCYEGI